MRRVMSTAFLTASIALGTYGIASAQGVENSHGTYHVRACADVAKGMARCHAHIVTDSKGNWIVNNAQPNSLPSGYGPADLRSAYGATATGKASTIIAIVDAYGYNNAQSDLATYRAKFNLPALATCPSPNPCFAKYNQTGQKSGYPGQNTGWAQESALDIEMASAMCPSCTIYLVEANTASFNDLATAENTAASLAAHVISNSYGGNENNSLPFDSAYCHSGIAITVSTGDSGFGVQFPASSECVTAVGGTSLTRGGGARGWTESAWSGAGSGCSTVYPQQSWQMSPVISNPSCSSRTVADVSAIADPNTGVAVFAPVSRRSSGWLVFGGTSVAAPLVAGVYGSNGGAVSEGSDPYSHQSSLFDVTTGSNGNCGNYLCNAGAGYDGPTGLGTPNGNSAF